jgi:hypothetical protein
MCREYIVWERNEQIDKYSAESKGRDEQMKDEKEEWPSLVQRVRRDPFFPVVVWGFLWSTFPLLVIMAMMWFSVNYNEKGALVRRE